MATYNDAVVGTDGIALGGKLTLDPTTKLPGPVTPTQPVKTLLVANGASVLVYDVTDPAHPVLIRTIG